MRIPTHSRFIYLHAWFPVGELLGRLRRCGFGGAGVTLLGELCHWRYTRPTVIQNVKLLASAPEPCLSDLLYDKWSDTQTIIKPPI